MAGLFIGRYMYRSRRYRTPDTDRISAKFGQILFELKVKANNLN